MYKDITGILLSGGKSTRMGTNKSFLKFNGKYIIEHVHEKLKLLFKKVIIITNTPEDYYFLGSEIYKDIYKDKGPLGGIHSGLVHSTTEKNFIISCDMPLVSTELMKFIIDKSGESQITAVTADGYVQQLCGLYKKSCIKTAGDILNEPDNSVCKVSKLRGKTKTKIIEENEIPFSIAGQCLNINKSGDYEKLKEMAV